MPNKKENFLSSPEKYEKRIKFFYELVSAAVPNIFLLLLFFVAPNLFRGLSSFPFRLEPAAGQMLNQVQHDTPIADYCL